MLTHSHHSHHAYTFLHISNRSLVRLLARSPFRYKVAIAKYYEEHPEAKEMYAASPKAKGAGKKKKGEDDGPKGPKKPQSACVDPTTHRV